MYINERGNCIGCAFRESGNADFYYDYEFVDSTNCK